MAIPALLESLEGVDPALQPHFVEVKDGDTVTGYRLDVTPTNGVELVNANGLKTALQKERTNVKTLTDKLKAFGDLSPEDAAAAVQTLNDLGDLDELKDIDAKVAKRIEQAQSKFEKDLQAAQKKAAEDNQNAQVTIKNLTGQLDEQLLTNAAAKAIAEHRGNQALLMPVIRTMARPVELEGGSRAIRVFDADGNERLSTKAGETSPMTLGQLVAELRETKDFEAAFAADPVSGGGTKTPGGTVGRSMVLSAADSKNPAAYRAAKEQAAKAGVELIIAEEG